MPLPPPTEGGISGNNIKKAALHHIDFFLHLIAPYGSNGLGSRESRDIDMETRYVISGSILLLNCLSK